MFSWFRSNPIRAIATTAFVFGGLALVGSDELSLPFLMPVGALIFAVAPAVLGLQVIATGRIRVPLGGSRGLDESYRGLGAYAWGVLLLLMSAAAFFYGVQQLGGFDNLAGDLLDRWPGLAAMAAGLILALFGLAQAAGASIGLRGRERKVSRWPERLGGALTALLGAAILAAGLLHTASPALFARLKSLLARALLALLER